MDRKHVNRTMYDDMEFPEYEFREFPMAVPVVDGRIADSPYNAKRKPHPVVIVNSRAELEALRGGEAQLVSQDYEGSVSRIESEDDIREALYLRAEQLGVKVDKRWSVERIAKAVSDGETVV